MPELTLFEEELFQIFRRLPAQTLLSHSSQNIRVSTLRQGEQSYKETLWKTCLVFKQKNETCVKMAQKINIFKYVNSIIYYNEVKDKSKDVSV